MRLKKLISIIVVSVTVCTLVACSSTSKTVSAKDDIKSITSISDVYATGEQVSAVAVQYSQNIDPASISADDFTVEDREIESVYVNNSPEKLKDTSKTVEGSYIIIELKKKEESSDMGRGGGNRDNGGKVEGQSSKDSTKNENTKISSTASTLDSVNYSVGDTGNGAGTFAKTPDTSVSITQLGEIKTESGNTISASNEAMNNTKSVENIVDDFIQLTFKDPDNGVVLGYNLYIPKNYDASKSYPLITFIHDASVVGSDTKLTLTQGNGATVWASEEEQSKHEAFVLAPQYEYQIVNDNFEASIALDTTAKLINSISNEYSIDTNRLYLTGQSMGCMSSIYLNTKYPDMFAASLLVAGQWDTSQLADMSNDNLWIIVSEGDSKAYPAMNEATSLWKSRGAVVDSTVLDAKLDADAINMKAEEVKNQSGNIKYTTLALGSTLSDSSSGGSEHLTTWKTVGYTIEPSHDWLFEQSK